LQAFPATMPLEWIKCNGDNALNSLHNLWKIFPHIFSILRISTVILENFSFLFYFALEILNRFFFHPMHQTAVLDHEINGNSN
jgi:hypothetical protein